MHHPTDRIEHTTAFVTPVMEHWLEREIAHWVHHEGSIRRPIAPWANALTTELHLAPNKFGCHNNPVVWVLHWHAVSLWSIPDSEPLRGFSKKNISKEEGKYEIFYLFWTHFIYAYMVLDICKRTTQQLKKPMAYSFRLAVSDVLYALPVVEEWLEWEIAQWFSQKAITPWTDTLPWSYI